MRYLFALLIALIPTATLAQSFTSPIGSSILTSGAACNGAGDDTVAINTYLATFTNGGLVYVPAGSQCAVGNPGGTPTNLIIPPNVIVRGASSSLADLGMSSIPTSGFLLNPVATIKMQAGASLRDLAIIRQGLTANPNDAQVIAAVAQWGTENSNAITLSAAGIRLEHLFIEGFNTAIFDYTYGNYIISDVVGDDYNGIFITGTGDNAAILDTRFEPYYCYKSTSCSGGEILATSTAQGSAGTTLQFTYAVSPPGIQVGDYANILGGASVGLIPLGTTVSAVSSSGGVTTVTLSASTTGAVAASQYVAFGGAVARPGTSFYLQGNTGNNTGWYCVRCFSFMYRGGIVLDGVGGGYLEQSDFEWQQSYDPATNGAGVIGVRMVGGASGAKIDDTSSGGHSIEFSDEVVDTPIDLHNLAIGDPDLLAITGLNGPNAIAGLFLEGLGGTQTTETVSGTVAAGNTASITINGATQTYTAQAGDGLLNVVFQLVRLCNTNETLAAATISCSWSGDAILIHGPAATALTVTASGTGSIVFTAGTAPASDGSWGQITNYTYSGPGTNGAIPAILVGPQNGFPVKITGIPVSNTGSYNGSISIDPTSVGLIQLQNLPVAEGTHVSSCGGGPTISTGSTDGRGTVTEGTSATGCTLTFRTPWPVKPTCTISSTNGAPYTGYSSTTTVLTITNSSASGNQYTYSCQP